jgi:amidase
MDDVFRLDAVGQAALVASGQLSALELVDAAIARCERLEPTVHALASTAFEAARARARNGQLTGPLAGVPFLIKDLLAYPGQSHALGSRLFAAQRAEAGSPFTQRLDAAGLITLGKTTTSELGLLGSTESLQSGVTKNPWALDRSATGSSGGAAAAVACGMVPMAHASDGGGSIRIPAAACGLFGFKPGPGRSVRAMDSDMAGLLIDHAVSRSVRDSALLLSLVEAEEPPGGKLGYVRGPTPGTLRIGFYGRTALGELPTPEVQAALSASVTLCRGLGHDLVEVDAPAVNGAECAEAFFTLAGAGIDQLARMLEPMFGHALGADHLEPFTLALLARYRAEPEGAVARARAAVASAGQVVREFLARFDAVLCPTLPISPPVLGTLAPSLPCELLIERMKTLAGYTAIHTFAGAPAMSVPLAQSAAGLPLGSHFAARPGAEGTLLNLAYQLEAAAPWAARWPALAR